MQIAVVEVEANGFAFAVDEASLQDATSEARRLGLSGPAKITTFKWMTDRRYEVKAVIRVEEINP